MLFLRSAMLCLPPYAVQAAGSGKPPAVVDKMVQGRLSKYFEEVSEGEGGWWRVI